MDIIKKRLGLLIPFGVGLIIALSCVSAYNGMVGMDEGVQGKWADVETQYQRRADLIPNLVNTVKGFAAHEKETLAAVVQARSEATSVKIDPTNMTAEQMAQYQQAQNGVSSALGKLLVVVEKYPDLKGVIVRTPNNVIQMRTWEAMGAAPTAMALKANQNFLELQAQLEGTENRITVARRNFNEAAKEYNTAIRKFPKNILAGMFGFEKKAYFEAEQGAEKAPQVEF